MSVGPGPARPSYRPSNVNNKGSACGDAGRLTYWADWDWDFAKLVKEPDGDGYADVGILAPGQSTNYDITGLIPASTYGTHTLLFFVDSYQATAESSEGNNYVTYTYHFTNDPSNYKNIPDFAITNVVLNPPTPAPGGLFTAKIYIVNKGHADGNAGTLAVWVSKSAWATNADGAAATGNIGMLTNGQSTLARFDNLVAPASTDGTTHHFRAFIDSANITAETSEGNNQKTVTYHYPH